MKPLIKWDETLVTGWSFMDDDHVRLIEMVNAVHAASRSGKGDEMIPRLIDELTDYCRTHFGKEETAMRQSRYPLAADHKMQHDLMMVRVAELEKGVAEGNAISASDLVSFLTDWQSDHIRRHDRDLARYLAKRASVGRGI